MHSHIHNQIIYIRSMLMILFVGVSVTVMAQSIYVQEVEGLTSDLAINEDSHGSIPTLSNFQSPDYRTPDASKIDQFRAENRFQYDTKRIEASWWEQTKEWFANLLNVFFGTLLRSATGLGLLGYIFIILFIILIVFFILKLLGVNVGAFVGRKKLDASDINMYSENVHEMDFETLISNALNNKDYRLAVRFMYLKNLKTLADKEFIKWNVNKTNVSYQLEIADGAVRNKFIDTTLIFDYVWYGEFPIDEHDFSKAYSELDEFNKLVSR